MQIMCFFNHIKTPLPKFFELPIEFFVGNEFTGNLIDRNAMSLILSLVIFIMSVIKLGMDYPFYFVSISLGNLVI
jgi:hypothetical protein